jgi:uncharacterized membrane protein YccC
MTKRQGIADYEEALEILSRPACKRDVHAAIRRWPATCARKRPGERSEPESIIDELDDATAYPSCASVRRSDARQALPACRRACDAIVCFCATNNARAATMCWLVTGIAALLRRDDGIKPLQAHHVTQTHGHKLEPSVLRRRESGRELFRDVAQLLPQPNTM